MLLLVHASCSQLALLKPSQLFLGALVGIVYNYLSGSFVQLCQ